MSGFWGELGRTAALVGAALLCLAGIAKVARPIGSGRAFATLGLSGRPMLVRGLGVAEFAVGVAHVTVGSRITAVAVGTTYAGFALFAAYVVWAEGAGVPCGCFGNGDAPLTAIHVGVDLVLCAATLITVVLGGPQGLPDGGVVLVAIFVSAAALATYLARLALVEFGSLLALFRWRPGDMTSHTAVERAR